MTLETAPEIQRDPVTEASASRRSERARPVGRILRFGVVGATGVAVNQGMLILLHGQVGVPLIVASVIAIELSLTSNYALNSIWTWKYDFGGSFRSVVLGWIRYHMVAGVVALVVNTGLLMLLTKVFDVPYEIANLIGIFAAAVLNFLGMEFWVFRKSKAA